MEEYSAKILSNTFTSGFKPNKTNSNFEDKETSYASKGMIWVCLTVFSKSLSFFSQIFLAYLLAVETYAIFGMAATAVALVAGFQNSSVAKAIINKYDNFEKIFPQYSAFAFQFGLLGMVILFGLGGIFQAIYEIPRLWAVLLVTGLSIPFLSLNTVLIASLSINYRFREINLIDMFRSFIYYIALLVAAILGAEGYTIAFATLFGTLVAHFLLLKKVKIAPSYFTFRATQFIETMWLLRWVLLSGFLAT